MEALTNSCPILLSGQETSLRRYLQFHMSPLCQWH